MLQKFLAYVIILWFSFQLLVDCQMIPKQRQWHTATYIDNKLYILGGAYTTNVAVSINEFFYLDISGSFNTNALSWQDLSSNTIPAHSGATTVIGGAKNNTLFLYGGATTNVAMALVYTFDPIGKVWSIPKVTGTGVRNSNLMGFNNNGKMYLWGGLSSLANLNDTNDMLILDTISLSFKNGSLVGAPSARYNYGGVLLPNKNIIYFGGYDMTNNIELSLTQIYIYDTINDKWSTQSTTGNQISERDGFSAVLGLDGQRIIIFGGTASTTGAPLVYEDSLYVLNLANFEWSVPQSSGNKPKSRAYHTANVIGKYMVISFGSGYDQSTESDILLLDISNNNQYVWSSTFDLSSSSSSPLSTPKSPTSSPTSKTTSAYSQSTSAADNTGQSVNTPALVGAILGSLFGTVLLSVGGFFLYKWYKKRQTQNQASLLIHGNSNYRNNEYVSPATSPITNNNDISDLRQEVQGLRQIILQNNEPTNNSRNNINSSTY